eukprot:TRINITY_DN5182_c1_g1_i1.p1 TRINITY_DN5182_c1_g1~~TRINITY_DN5182_c1_g1_i1.p1  ORF type:complete len:384 (+),score=77.57 TRINITY_DN5182_c1_g1_i1:70-1152(+)
MRYTRPTSKDPPDQFIKLFLLVLILSPVTYFFVYLASTIFSLSDDVLLVKEIIQRPAAVAVLSTETTEPSSSPQPEQTADFTAVQNSLADLRQKLAEAQSLLRRNENRLSKLYNVVNPWERCLRFSIRRGCIDPGSVEDGVPPCAAYVLKGMLLALTDALDVANITHWLSFGTLLGATRSGSILPWTGDIDVTVPSTEFKALGPRLTGNTALEEAGYLFFYDPKYPDLGRMCATDMHDEYLPFAENRTDRHETLAYYNGWPYADIYQGAAVPGQTDRMMVVYGPSCRFASQTIYPLGRVSMFGREMPTPHETARYLTQLYGPDFMAEPPEKARTSHTLSADLCKPEWQPSVNATPVVAMS